MNELNSRHFANNNGKNGLLMKIIVGALAAGMVASATGVIHLYREVGVLAVDSNTRRIENIERLLADIASDRDRRTIILQNIHEQIVDLQRRLDLLERKGHS